VSFWAGSMFFFFWHCGAYFDIVCETYLSWWSRLYWRVLLRFYSVFSLFFFYHWFVMLASFGLAHEHAANVVAYGACILVFSINFALLWLCCWFFSCLIGFFGLCQCVYFGVMFIADLDLCDLGSKVFSGSVNGCYIVLCFLFFSYLC